MKKKQSIATLTTVALMAFMAAAEASAQSIKQSTVTNSDGTVTFLYENKDAKDVQVDVQFAGKNKMTKDANGIWKATLGPAEPDMYPYNFVVDGVSIMDPLNDQYFPNEGFKNSLLEIKSPSGHLAHDIRSDVKHGTVEYIHYYSNALGGTNNAIVYLPPSYGKDAKKKYPVFYLISGTTDTEEVYFKVGRMNYIADNLIAEGKAKEMIIVLPYGNPYKLLPPSPDRQMPAMGFGNDVFSNDLVNDLMPYVEKHYRTIADRDHRAIGGFSRGGNQGLSNGLRNLDKFSYLCSYSSFTNMDIPNVYDNAKETNSKIHLFWSGVGTDDFLYGNARDYTEFLDKKGIRCVKEYTTNKFGHTWMNAKFFLDKTLRLLFNEKASAKAMQAATPTKAKTGEEQQFTPGVMARLFPKPIISPEYFNDSIVFRFKAENASNVSLKSELATALVPMKKNSDGVWEVTIKENVMKTFKYCFVGDNMPVADPSNMFLSPDKGFKHSVCQNPLSSYSFASMGNIEHGHIAYNLNQGQECAIYKTPDYNPNAEATVVILIPGNDDTLESWFKVGGADAIADKLYAEGKLKNTIIYVADNDANAPAAAKRFTLRASEYRNWSDRSIALLNLLDKTRKLRNPMKWESREGSVTNVSEWNDRRNEISQLIQKHEIGIIPEVKREQIKARMAGDTLFVTVTVGANSITLSSVIKYPTVGKAPYPLLIGSSRISLPDTLLKVRPLARMNFNERQVNGYSQFRGDTNRENYGFVKLYPELIDNGAYSEWAWGFQRLIDGLELLGPEVTKIDTKHIGVTGCSYAGKMALFCGAFDPRVALVIAQEPGGGGAAAWRVSHTIDGVEDLDRTDYHWFKESLREQFHGENVYNLPYDHHELCALVCPRAFLMLGNTDYKWLADESGYVSVNAAKQVWDNLGIADRFGYSILGNHPHCMLPSAQYPEVEAFIDRFLLGKDANTTGINIAPMFKDSVNLDSWIEK